MDDRIQFVCKDYLNDNSFLNCVRQLLMKIFRIRLDKAWYIVNLLQNGVEDLADILTAENKYIKSLKFKSFMGAFILDVVSKLGMEQFINKSRITHLDVGTGDGILLETMAEIINNGLSTGIDIIPCRNMNIDTCVYDGKRMPFVSYQFNFITAIFALHHMDNEIILDTLKEIYRVCSPGGYLLIKENDAYSKQTRCIIELEHLFCDIRAKNKQPTYGRLLLKSKSEWELLIAEIGFKKISEFSCETVTKEYYALYQK